MQREREAQHPDGTDIRGRTTGDPTAERSPASDERRLDVLVDPQVLGDGAPRRIDLRGRRGCSATRDAVRLLDEGDRQTRSEGDVSRKAQVDGIDATTGAMAEHQQSADRDLRPGEVHSRITMRGRDE